MIKVKDPRIQVLCIQILGKIRDQRAIPVLKKALQSPFEYVLIAALDALYQTRSEEALTVLSLTFQHPTNDSLLKALKDLEIKESFIPIFLMALESPVTELKRIAMESLKKIVKNHSDTKKIESAIEEAIKHIKNGENPDTYIKKVIEEMDKEFPFKGQFERLAADAKSGSHKAMQTLVDFLQLDWRDSHFIPLCDKLADIGKPVVPMLIEALKHSKGEPRRNVLIAIARMGPIARDAAPLLTKIIKQGEKIEQRYAQLALDRIQGKPVRSGFWFDDY
jgi:HEAT repeat protein